MKNTDEFRSTPVKLNCNKQQKDKRQTKRESNVQANINNFYHINRIFFINKIISIKMKEETGVVSSVINEKKE